MPMIDICYTNKIELCFIVSFPLHDTCLHTLSVLIAINNTDKKIVELNDTSYSSFPYVT